jgi:hypothetical protein
MKSFTQLLCSEVVVELAKGFYALKGSGSKKGVEFQI